MENEKNLVTVNEEEKESIMVTTFKGAERFIIQDGVIVGLTTEERNRIIYEIGNIFDWCDYYPEWTYEAVGKIVDRWFEAKREWLNLIVKSPFYNGKYAIEFDKPIKRSFDREVYYEFITLMKEWAKMTLKEITFGANWKFRELCNMRDRVDSRLSAVRYYQSELGYGRTNEERTLVEDLTRFQKYIDDAYNNYRIADNRAYDIEEYDRYKKVKYCLTKLWENPTQFINKETEEYINAYLPKFKAKEGQKTSRVINKLCGMLGLDKVTNAKLKEWHMAYDGQEDNKNIYNWKFSDCAAACNPLDMQKHIFISVDPIDFLSMSWGTNWSSCHSIDKDNKHGYKNDYRGCYSTGTLSYMLDKVSVVFYILGKDAVKEAEESGEPVPRKEMRQMFHIGKEKFIQGRLYPYDQTDRGRSAEPEDYIQYREIMQSLLSELWGVPNLWTNKRGTGACDSETISNGTHYTDYTHYSNCNVSYLKEYSGTGFIEIGHDPICPKCGDTHSGEENCFCADCLEEGEWCEYHQRYENEDMTEVHGYGYVCNDALEEEDDFVQCAHCGDWYYIGGYNDNGVRSERDDLWFCDTYCAERHGYYYISECEDYISEDEFSYSEIDDEDLPTFDMERYDLCYAIYDEYDNTTIARKSSCYYINGKWYDSSKCVEIDGEYVPEWDTEVDSETGEIRRIA